MNDQNNYVEELLQRCVRSCGLGLPITRLNVRDSYYAIGGMDSSSLSLVVFLTVRRCGLLRPRQPDRPQTVADLG